MEETTNVTDTQEQPQMPNLGFERVTDDVNNTENHEQETTEEKKSSVTWDIDEDDLGIPAEETADETEKFNKEDTPLYIPELKEKYGIEKEDLSKFSEYKDSFGKFSELKSVLEDEDVKTFLDFKKNGGTLADFIEASRIDVAKFTDEQLVKMSIEADLKGQGIVNNLEKHINTTYNKEFGKELERINAELAELEDDEFESDENGERKAELELEKEKIESKIAKIVETQKKLLEDKKVDIMKNNNNQSQINYEERAEKFRTFLNDGIDKAKELKLKLNDGQVVDIPKEEFKAIAQGVLMQEQTEEGVPFIYLQGHNTYEVVTALYLKKNIDKIVSNAVSKAVVQKEKALIAEYNNKQVPTFKDNHIDTKQSNVIVEYD